MRRVVIGFVLGFAAMLVFARSWSGVVAALGLGALVAWKQWLNQRAAARRPR